MPDEVEKALERSADKRHVTFDTQQVSFDGTMAMEASLELPDALALAEAVKSGAEHLARLGSTDTIDGRRATALGDLARHQLTIGFDDPADDASGDGFEAGALWGPSSKPAARREARHPGRAVRPPVRRRPHPPRHHGAPGPARRCVPGSSRPANGCCRWSRSAPGAAAPTSP